MTTQTTKPIPVTLKKGTAKTAHLPTPDERPAADVVLYDGDCRFCTSQVQNLAWLAGDRLAYLSLHDPSVAKRYPDLTHEQLMEQMYLVTSEGKKYAGAAAFRYLTRKLPSLFVLAPLLHIPFSLPLWQWAYRQVAKRRYYLMGKMSDQGCDGDACSIHFGK